MDQTPGRRLVMHVTNSLGVTGGAEQQLVANLAAFGDPRLAHHLVCIYEEDYGSRAPLLPAGVDVTYLHGAGVRRAGRLGTLRRLYREVRRRRPDLLHSSVAEASLVSRIVGVLTRTPVVESLINISHEPVRLVDDPAVTRWKLWLHRLVDRATMRRVRRFHALSRAVADSWVATVGLDPSRVTIIPRGVDAAGIAAQAAESDPRAELGVDGRPLLLAVGRQAAQKGHRYLVAAMAEVVRRHPDALLVIAGQPGNMSSKLETLVADLDLTDHVRLLGARDDVPALMRSADVFAYPSLFEGLGVALLEAMALGLPAVASNIAPINDFVVHGESGLLVPPQDSAALAAAVTRLLEDRELAARLGAAARDHVTHEFRIEEAAARLEALYAEVLELTDQESPPTSS